MQSRNYALEMMPAQRGASSLEIRELFAYNPNLDYKFFMVPGILVLLVTLVGMLLSAMNIVREKEIGTIEQLNVTPIRRWQFISAKMLPFWIIGLLELAFGLVIARLVFNVPMIGNVALVFVAAAVYLLVVLSIGLLISTITQTQQQAMFIAWFFLVIFILMSGLFTPIQSMPDWAQAVTRLNPVSYFIEIMRRVLLKGAGWQSIQYLVGSLAIYAAITMSVAVWRYRKVAQ
jgi:ABC-2 type transport system permease protein